MTDDELNHWIAQLGAMTGWTLYQVGDDPPPPLVAVCQRHFFTDVVIIRSARSAVAYRTLFTDQDRPPDASEALWTYSGDASSTVNAILALSQPSRGLRKLPAPPNYQLPDGELRDISDSKGDLSR